MDDWLGALAGTLTTVAFVPQVWRIHQRRSAEDVSWGMFLIFSAGVLLWLIYGLRIDARPIVLANVVTLVLALVILALKWRYDRPGRDAAECSGKTHEPGAADDANSSRSTDSGKVIQ
jgi:MtN3 and saliva related transmembrane protein